MGLVVTTIATLTLLLGVAYWPTRDPHVGTVRWLKGHNK